MIPSDSRAPVGHAVVMIYRPDAACPAVSATPARTAAGVRLRSGVPLVRARRTGGHRHDHRRTAEAPVRPAPVVMITVRNAACPAVEVPLGPAAVRRPACPAVEVATVPRRGGPACPAVEVPARPGCRMTAGVPCASRSPLVRRSDGGRAAIGMITVGHAEAPVRPAPVVMITVRTRRVRGGGAARPGCADARRVLRSRCHSVQRGLREAGLRRRSPHPRPGP